MVVMLKLSSEDEARNKLFVSWSFYQAKFFESTANSQWYCCTLSYCLNVYVSHPVALSD